MLDASTATSICPGPGGLRSKRDEFQGFQVTGSADLQAHAVALMVDGGGPPFVGAERRAAQPCGVPVAAAPGGLVLLRTAQQFLRHLLGVAVVFQVDLARPQLWILRADHPEQATQSGLLQVGPVVRQDDLGPPGHDIQARRLCGQFRQLASRCERRDAPAPGPAADLARPGRRPVAGTRSPHRRGRHAHECPAVRALAEWSACSGQCRVVHCAPRDFSASVSLGFQQIRFIRGVDQQPLADGPCQAPAAASAAASRWSAAVRPARGRGRRRHWRRCPSAGPARPADTLPSSSSRSRSASNADAFARGHPQCSSSGRRGSGQ